MPAVVFDFDGVIIDSEHEIALLFIDALQAHGAHLELNDMAHLFGSTDLDHEWEALLERHLGGALSLAQLEAQLDAELNARLDALPILPGVEEVIDAARVAGWPVGMATGQNRTRLNEHLDRLGLADRFDAIVTRADVPRGKPEPDIYLEVAARLGADPVECVAIEDSVPGCQAALAAGMTVIICPSRVTAGCTFPAAAHRIHRLTDFSLANAFG